eukprot:1175402-Prorocentrum_minimum.AAC.1
MAEMQTNQATQVYAPSPHPIGPRREYVLPSHIRLVRAASICSLPTSDWSEPQVYAPSPHPIGPRREYMLPPHIRLVQAA